MTETLKEIGLGDSITVHTLPGRDETIIGRMQDGRIILFDQHSEFFSQLGLDQTVDCHVVALKDSFVVVSPFRKPKAVTEPEAKPISPVPELEEDTIVVELEKLIESVSGNAEVIPRALLRVIQLEQLIIKILKGKI